MEPAKVFKRNASAMPYTKYSVGVYRLNNPHTHPSILQKWFGYFRLCLVYAPPNHVYAYEALAVAPAAQNKSRTS